MALRTTLARLAQPLRAQSAAFSAIPTPRPKYTERQEKLGRPMSPHVTTYAFPAVAISSITQRVTGVLLSVGVGGVAAGSLAGVDMAALATAVSCYPVKFIVAFPLTYHYAGALRHTLWDRKPETMLNNKDAEKSSYLVMGGSTLAAAGLAARREGMRGEAASARLVSLGSCGAGITRLRRRPACSCRHVAASSPPRLTSGWACC